MGLKNLVDAFRVLGLEPHITPSEDISLECLKYKVTNPQIAQSLGGEISLPLIEKVDWCANLLDSYSASLDWNFLLVAQQRYEEILQALSMPLKQTVEMIVAAIFNYFSYERVMAMRYRRGDVFAHEELIEHLLRRGSDSILYATLLVELDQVDEPSITTGFRIRQALWDFADDIQDLEQDRKTKGVNLLLLARMNYQLLRKLAEGLYEQANLLVSSTPLRLAIEQEYAKVMDNLPS